MKSVNLEMQQIRVNEHGSSFDKQTINCKVKEKAKNNIFDAIQYFAGWFVGADVVEDGSDDSCSVRESVTIIVAIVVERMHREIKENIACASSMKDANGKVIAVMVFAALKDTSISSVAELFWKFSVETDTAVLLCVAVASL